MAFVELAPLSFTTFSKGELAQPIFEQGHGLTLENELMIGMNIKFISKPVRIPLSELEYAYEKLGSKKIKSFSILQIKYLGRKFESRKIFVRILEEMLIHYYQGIVQHLKKWEKPVPQIPAKEIKQETL